MIRIEYMKLEKKTISSRIFIKLIIGNRFFNGRFLENTSIVPLIIPILPIRLISKGFREVCWRE